MCVPAQITPFGHGTGGRAGNQVAAHIGGDARLRTRLPITQCEANHSLGL